MEANISLLTPMVHEIRNAVVGNEVIGLPGLVKRVEQLEEDPTTDADVLRRIELLEKSDGEQNKKLWTIGGILIGVNVAASVLIGLALK